MCLHYIGGILKHAPALAAFTNPSTNSYKRLTPGFEAPVLLAYSSRNRSAGIRIPMYSPSPKAKRIEVRFPDPAANPYLAFAAMLMAGLDGIENKINPGEPAEKDLYDLEAKEAAKIRTMPGSLDEALLIWRRTISSCSRAGCSARTSLRPGSGTSAPRKWIRCGCGRIRTSSSCIMTCSRGFPRGERLTNPRGDGIHAGVG
jgi:hypothetical protein